MEKYKKRQGYLRAIVIIVILAGVVLAGLWWTQQRTPDESQEEPNNQQQEELKTTVDRGFDEEGWERMQQEIAEDEQALQDAIDAGEKTLTQRLQLGNSYYAAGELQKAVDQYNKILEDYPNDPPALENKGQALYEMGDYYGAEASWRKAVSIDPQEHTYLKLDELYRKQLTGRYNEFGPMLEEAVANLGQTRGLMVALGNWHEAQGNIERAISHFEIAIELSGGDASLEEIVDELKKELE